MAMSGCSGRVRLVDWSKEKRLPDSISELVKQENRIVLS
jgi:hypothetical protein